MPTDLDGVALANMALTVGLIATLNAKRVVTPAEVSSVIDAAMLRIEEFSSDSVQTENARAYIEHICAITGIPRATESRTG